MAAKLDPKEVLQMNFYKLQEEYAKAEQKISAMNDVSVKYLQLIRNNREVLADLASSDNESEDIAKVYFELLKGQLSEICKSMAAVELLDFPKVPDFEESKTLKSSDFDDCGIEFIYAIYDKISKGEKFVAIHKSKSRGIRYAKLSVWRRRLLIHSLQPKIDEELSGSLCYRDLMKSLNSAFGPHSSCFIRVNLKGNMRHEIHFNLRATEFKAPIIDTCTGVNGRSFRRSFVFDSYLKDKSLRNITDVTYLFQFVLHHEVCLWHRSESFNHVNSVGTKNQTFLTLHKTALAFVQAKDTTFAGIIIGTVVEGEVRECKVDVNEIFDLSSQFGLISECGLSVYLRPGVDFPICDNP